MAFFIQHGHAKSDKLTTALNSQTADGVIFGARNETPDRMPACIAELREIGNEVELLFDPQFYVCTLVPPNDRYLPQYPFYMAGRTASDFTGARRIRDYARQTLGFQAGLGVDALISSTVLFESFSDRWHQIALNLADASLEYHLELKTPPPLLLSFVFSEAALSSREEIDRFLDTVTQEDWGMAGFYLLVARTESAYNQRFDSERLAHLLYLVHVLGHINGLRVICGYTDFVGIPLRAAGAEAFASGWFHSLRQFQTKSFIKREAGGQPPRERYSSAPLFNSIMLGEVQDIYEVRLLDQALSGVPLDRVITSAANPQDAPWTLGVSEQHHWQTLRTLDRQLSGDVRRDVISTMRKLRDATGRYTVLESARVTFERYTGKDHLNDWLRGLREFQTMAGLSAS